MQGWKDRPPEDTESDYEHSAFALTHALAGRLCDELDEGTVVRILTSDHVVAVQTGAVFQRVLEERGFKVSANTAAEELAPNKPAANAAEMIKQQTEAVLVVGHQPQLTLIARELTKGQLPGNVLPLGGSEVAGLTKRNECGPHRLQWLLTAKPDSLLAELKAKIQSKYDVAKFFLGALVVGTGLALNEAIWDGPHPVDRVIAAIAALSALVSLGFTAATLFSYDRLLMPTTFWTGGDDHERARAWSVRRPPSQAHVILFYEMVHVWTAFFIPAISAAFVSLGLFVVALGHRAATDLPDGWFAPPYVWYGSLVGLPVLVALAYLVPVMLFNRGKPRLGFDD